MPPELFNGTEEMVTENTLVADVFALGVILWQLWFQREPFEGWSDAAIISHVNQGKRLILSFETYGAVQPGRATDDFDKVLKHCELEHFKRDFVEFGIDNVGLFDEVGLVDDESLECVGLNKIEIVRLRAYLLKRMDTANLHKTSPVVPMQSGGPLIPTNEMPAALKRLITNSWAHNPVDRLTAQELLSDFEVEISPSLRRVAQGELTPAAAATAAASLGASALGQQAHSTFRKEELSEFLESIGLKKLEPAFEEIGLTHPSMLLSEDFSTDLALIGLGAGKIEVRKLRSRARLWGTVNMPSRNLSSSSSVLTSSHVSRGAVL